MIPIFRSYYSTSSATRICSTSSSSATSPRKGKGNRPPSRVQDPDGPTPELEPYEPEEIDPDDVEELREIKSADDLPYPIPHQPWRRGDMAGCDDPIAAEWRRQAEKIIYNSVALVGGSVLDVTWFLTTLLVTLDEDIKPPRDFSKASGPEIEIVDPAAPQYEDPTDPNPKEIWADEDDVLYQRETEEEAAEAKQKKMKMYAPKDPELDPVDEPHIPIDGDDDDIPLFKNEETRDEIAIRVTDEAQIRADESDKPIDLDTIRIDTAALSTIAQAILDALTEQEDELKILQRHELVLTSPGPPDVIETQKQFDAYRGSNVIVETQDPFESNRTLKGKIVDRNSMDLIINQKGRMVTIPHNFIKCVRLPKAKVAS